MEQAEHITSDEETFVVAEREYYANRMQILRQQIAVAENNLRMWTSRLRESARVPDEQSDPKTKGAARTHMIRASGRLSKLKEDLEHLEQNSARMYANMCAVPRVKRIFVQQVDGKKELVIETHPQFGKSRRFRGWYSSWRRLGPYRTHIQYPSMATDIRDDIRIFNLEGTRPCPVPFLDAVLDGIFGHSFLRDTIDYHGPTDIGSTGRVGCFGTAKIPLQNALIAHDWPTAVAILVRFPECAGHSRNIRYWPKAKRRDVPRWYKETFGWW